MGNFFKTILSQPWTQSTVLPSGDIGPIRDKNVICWFALCVILVLSLLSDLKNFA